MSSKNKIDKDALKRLFDVPFENESFIANFRSLRCPENIAFDSKILNTPSEVLGIRIPVLRTIAKILKPQAKEIVLRLTPNCYEIFSLKGLLITEIDDVDFVLSALQNFVPTIDNWATCDLMCGDLKIVQKNREVFLDFIKNCLNDEREFVIRVGVVLLMKFYLDAENLKNTFSLLNNLNSKYYYVNMAIGWLIAEAYLVNKADTISFLKNAKVSNDAINLGIKKIRESYRVSPVEKQEILIYKRK